MSTLLSPRGRPDDDFAPDAPAQQLQASKRNWRFPMIMGGFVAALVLTAIVEPKLFWFWWPSGEEEKVEIKTGFDIAAMAAFDHPPVEPDIRTVQIPVPTPAPEPPQSAPAIPAPERVEIEPQQLQPTRAYVPQSEQQVAYMFDGLRPLEGWGCAIRPGLNVIHATFNDDIRWDYGGPISATVTEDVLSAEAMARGERRVLIPNGAQLIGIASSEQLDRGMDLAAGPLWTEATFVDTMGMPRAINLFDAQGAGASGINAIGGDVDARWGPIIAAATLFTVLDVIGGISVNLGSDSDNAVNVRVGGNSAAEIGREVVRSMLDWKPRIFTPKGTMITVKPLKPIRVCRT